MRISAATSFAESIPPAISQPKAELQETRFNLHPDIHARAAGC